MLAMSLVLGTLVLGAAWIVSEFKHSARTRIALGLLVIACASSAMWALKDLEYRLLSFWVSLAFEEVSVQVKAGNTSAVEQAIAHYLDKVRHDPSNRAASELIHELNAEKFGGTQPRTKASPEGASRG